VAGEGDVKIFFPFSVGLYISTMSEYHIHNHKRRFFFSFKGDKKRGAAGARHRNRTGRRGRKNTSGPVRGRELQRQVGWVESYSKGPKLAALKECLF
jgi:hypothetical protein